MELLPDRIKRDARTASRSVAPGTRAPVATQKPWDFDAFVEYALKTYALMQERRRLKKHKE
jgi:hypothetical protein